ncbi:acyl-CoA-like ligand-binding transcription factor [Kitasatospora kifunensis]|uniref:AcrR family transcriptional regulator n=1 Tax=Kitasatospora kifunensis TaxID=58351 RepID=A0A7W7R7J7_KITKI|nr:TetR family transcriptional regulator [Kitasatospora kifunensis]MBB4926734.1 AcrR family transcriptional regulator [Kitasatospora kifunensis]
MTQGDDVQIGLRERKKRETRVSLSQATIRLCVERGWDNVTVESIAAAANVSVRTFRNYFSSKAEAIAAGHLERMLRIADTLRARPAAEPLWESIVHAVVAEFAQGDEEVRGGEEVRRDESVRAGEGSARSALDQRWRDGLRLMLAEPALQGEVAKANAAAQEVLAEAVAERTGTDAARDVYPKLVAAVIGAGSAVAVEHCLRADPPTPLVPVLREVFDRLAAGLPTP